MAEVAIVLLIVLKFTGFVSFLFSLHEGIGEVSKFIAGVKILRRCRCIIKNLLRFEKSL